MGKRRAHGVRSALLAAMVATAFGVGAIGHGSVVAKQATPAVAATPVAGASIEFTGAVERGGPVTIAHLQRLPSETIEATYESGGSPETHTFTGVRLFDALELVGLAADPEARNPLLRHYLVVEAVDGYGVVVSGGEIDPNFGDVPLLLAWEQDGQPLAGDDGPLRLVAPGDTRGGRYVWGVRRIEVRSIDEPAG